MRLRVGTRRSPLARVQTAYACNLLRAATPGIVIETLARESTGDRLRDKPLRDHGGKGLFVKELDDALLASEIDCAVHSLKDVPTELPPGIVIAAVPRRADPRDAVVTLGGRGLLQLADDARVGTSSPRRAAQLLALRPGVRVVLLRGNVETRLRRLIDGDFDATLLAIAGIERLGLELRPATAVLLDPHEFVPSPGQGALCFTARAGDARTINLLRPLDDAASHTAARAERSAARTLGGSCFLPVGAYAEVHRGRVRLVVVLSSPDGGRLVRQTGEADAARAELLGREIGQAILESGGADIVAALPEAP